MTICALIIDIMAFITFWGPSLYCVKKLLNALANWQVYTTAWQMYMPNVHVECRTRKKKTRIFLVIFCIILTWIYSKLPKIQKFTKKCTDCEIHGSWLKDAFINDQYLHFVSSLLSNIQHCNVSFVILNSSVCSHTYSTMYLFSSLQRWSRESNKADTINKMIQTILNIVTQPL